MGVTSTFVELLAGKEFVAFTRPAGIELGVRNQEDDEFAEVSSWSCNLGHL